MPKVTDYIVMCWSNLLITSMASFKRLIFTIYAYLVPIRLTYQRTSKLGTTIGTFQARFMIRLISNVNILCFTFLFTDKACFWFSFWNTVYTDYVITIDIILSFYSFIAFWALKTVNANEIATDFCILSGYILLTFMASFRVGFFVAISTMVFSIFCRILFTTQSYSYYIRWLKE